MPFRQGSRTFDAKRNSMTGGSCGGKHNKGKRKGSMNRKGGKMYGGSRASERVMSHLKTKGMPADYTAVSAPMGVDGAGVQPYELTGGSKASDCTVGFANAGMTDQDDYYTMMDLPRGCSQSGGVKTTRRTSKSKTSSRTSSKEKTLGPKKSITKPKKRTTQRKTSKRPKVGGPVRVQPPILREQGVVGVPPRGPPARLMGGPAYRINQQGIRVDLNGRPLPPVQQRGGGKTTKKSLSKRTSSKGKTLAPKKSTTKHKKKTTQRKTSKRSKVVGEVRAHPPILREQGVVGVPPRWPPQAQQRGGGFSNMTGCGPINYPHGGAQYAKHFGGTSCPSKEELMNPVNLAGAETTSLGGHAMY